MWIAVIKVITGPTLITVCSHNWQLTETIMVWNVWDLEHKSHFVKIKVYFLLTFSSWISGVTLLNVLKVAWWLQANVRKSYSRINIVLGQESPTHLRPCCTMQRQMTLFQTPCYKGGHDGCNWQSAITGVSNLVTVVMPAELGQGRGTCHCNGLGVRKASSGHHLGLHQDIILVFTRISSWSSPGHHPGLHQDIILGTSEWRTVLVAVTSGGERVEERTSATEAMSSVPDFSAIRSRSWWEDLAL